MSTRAVMELVAAIDAIVDAWDGGDLAGAVNEARMVADDHRIPPVEAAIRMRLEEGS